MGEGSEEREKIGLRDVDTLSQRVMRKRLSDLGRQMEV